MSDEVDWIRAALRSCSRCIACLFGLLSQNSWVQPSNNKQPIGDHVGWLCWMAPGFYCWAIACPVAQLTHYYTYTAKLDEEGRAPLVNILA